jgi:hypothetical protein
MPKSIFMIEMASRYLNQLEAALVHYGRRAVETALHNMQWGLDTLDEETELLMSEYGMKSILGEGNEVTGPVCKDLVGYKKASLNFSKTLFVSLLPE